MTSYFTMRSFKFRYHEFQIKFCYISIEIYIYCVNRKLCFCIYNSFIKVCQKRQKCRLGVLTVNDKISLLNGAERVKRVGGTSLIINAYSVLSGLILIFKMYDLAMLFII
jgi:hypothetical protein